MLSDINTYTPLPAINLKLAELDICKINAGLLIHKCIVKAQYNFVCRGDHKVPVLYGLPKIHKKDCPLRPIVSQM